MWRFGARSLFAPALLLCAVWLGGCERDAEPAATPTAPQASVTVPAPRQLAIAFVEDLHAQRWDAALAKMEHRYRDKASPQHLKLALDQISSFYGTPLAYNYKTQVDGQRHYPDGEVKPMNKFWFTTPTSQHAAGVFTFVEVVPDGDRLAVAAFSILTYPDEPPEMLR